LECKYIEVQTYNKLIEKYDNIIGKLVNMSLHPDNGSF